MVIILSSEGTVVNSPPHGEHRRRKKKIASLSSSPHPQAHLSESREPHSLPVNTQYDSTMVIKKPQPKIPLRILIKCAWSGARIPTPPTLTTSSTITQVISSISSSLPPLFTNPLGEWNDPQPFIVYMRTNVLKRDWDVTKVGDFCTGGSILLTLNLPKDTGGTTATEPPVVSSSDSIEPMDIDDIPAAHAAGFQRKTPKQAMRYIVNSNFDQDSQECLQTILKMVDNLLSKNDAKFRSIRISNKTVDTKIISKKGGLDLFFALGFEYDDSQGLAFDFDNSKSRQREVGGQSDMIILRPEDEDHELLTKAREELSHMLTAELNVSNEDVPSMPRVKPLLGTAIGASAAPSFDPYKSRSFNIQAAAVGAPNPDSIIPDGTVSAGKSVTEQKLEILQQKQQRLELSMQSLTDRGISAFLPGETGPIISLSSPGDADMVVGHGKGDSSILAGQMMKKMEERKKQEEGGFTTKTMRKFVPLNVLLYLQVLSN